MADYWVYHGATGGNGSGDSWTNAFVSWAAAQTGGGGNLGANRYFVADDHVDPTTGANKTHVGPTSGLPCVIISSDRDDTGSVPAYAVGTTAQFNTTDGNFTLTLDGSFALYGVRLASGGASSSSIAFVTDNDEFMFLRDCTLAPGAGGRIAVSGASEARFINLHVDLTADGVSARISPTIDAMQGVVRINGLTFTQPGGGSVRTGSVLGCGTASYITEVSGADFSGFTNATECEIVVGPESTGSFTLSNCKTKANAVYCAAPTTGRSGGVVTFVNVGPEDDPKRLYVTSTRGTLENSASVRTGGATVEGEATAWKIVTTALCSEETPFYTPWIYGTIGTTGSKTFTLYVAQDGGSAGLNNAEIWLEVEYYGDG
jgi:hypothetical protein